MPRRPRANRPQGAGSKTGLAKPETPTSKPYQYSYLGFVHEMLSNVPLNITVPFPSLPDTTLPLTLIADPPYSALGPPAMKSGVALLNTNVAGMSPAPRLQIAITGSTTGEEKVMVLRLSFPPVNWMMPFVEVGASETTDPSANVLVGV